MERGDQALHVLRVFDSCAQIRIALEDAPEHPAHCSNARFSQKHEALVAALQNCGVQRYRCQMLRIILLEYKLPYVADRLRQKGRFSVANFLNVGGGRFHLLAATWLA